MSQSVRSGIWSILCQDAAESLNIAHDVPPNYEHISHSSHSRNASLDTVAALVTGPPPEVSSPPTRSQHSLRSTSFLHMEVPEVFTYTYDLFVSDTRLQVIISVESDQEPNRPNSYTLSLSMKIGPVERAISNPVTMKFAIDPRSLDFIVFVFPPRSSLPANSLHHLRVWLRTPTGVDHRIFGEQDLWFGKDVDFGAIPDASFASLRNTTSDMAIYQGTVGRAHVNFVIRWTLVEQDIYAFSLDYEAGGVGRSLFENYHLRLSCEPSTITYLIYSIPVSSNPPGASHRLRFWLRAPTQPSQALSQQPPSQPSAPLPVVPAAVPIAGPSAHLNSSYPPSSFSAVVSSLSPSNPSSSSSPSPSSSRQHQHQHQHIRHPLPVPNHDAQSHLFQRLWKSDEFKVGAHLSFEAVGAKIVLATRAIDGPSDPRWVTPLAPNQRLISRLIPGVGVDETGEHVNDR